MQPSDIRAIIPEHVKDLALKLREKGYGLTSVDAYGSQGPVKLIYTIVMRKNLPEVAGIIQQAYPSAFFTVEELRSVEHGVFPRPSSRPQDPFLEENPNRFGE